MMVGGRIAKCEHIMEDVWTSVVDTFASSSIECMFTFGAHDRELNTVPPRIHFERTGGSFQFAGTRFGDNACATIGQSSDAYVWGLQEGEDFEKHADVAALGLVVELIGALAAVVPTYPDGKNGLEITYSNETHVLRYGAQFVVSFQFLAPVKWVTAEEYRLIAGVDANLVTRS